MAGWCERCEQHLAVCHCTVFATDMGAPVKLPNQPTAADLFAAYLTVDVRQARRKKIKWSCRLCPMQGHDGPGLTSFWAHWDAFHDHPRVPLKVNL